MDLLTFHVFVYSGVPSRVLNVLSSVDITADLSMIVPLYFRLC